MGKSRKNCTEAEKKIVIRLKKKRFTNRYISEIVGVNQSTVGRIFKRWAKTGTAGEKKRPGRPPKITERLKNFIVGQSLGNRCHSAAEIRHRLEQVKGVQVDISSVRSVLRKEGLNGRIARKKPFVSPANRKKRLAFAEEHANWSIDDWKTIVWSDEKKFNRLGSDGATYVRRRVGEEYLPECMKGTVKHGGGSVMAWASFSWYGPGPMRRIMGIIDRFGYRDILQEEMLPYASSLPQPVLFQQDNAPIHTAKLLKEFFQKNRVKVMEWPPQSPDLNPIENLWNEVDKFVKREAPKTLDQLERCITKAWSEISHETCQKLVASMPRRCQAVMKSRGYPTRY